MESGWVMHHPFEVLNGLDQGCPSSGPFYIFHNADLIDILPSKDKIALAFVGDCIVATRAPTVVEANNKVVNMVTRPKGALDWSCNHNSKFKLDKTGLVVFTNRRVSASACLHKTIPILRPSVIINSQEIKPLPTFKFLGLILDQELKFKAHVDHAAAKRKFWIMQTRCILKTVKGTRGHLSQQLYMAAAVPAMLYAASVWLIPTVRSNEKGCKSTGSVGAAMQLTRVQRMASIHITGAMCTTASDILNTYANLLPINLLIDKHCFQEALQLTTLPNSHLLYLHVKQATKQKTWRHPSPPHELLYTYSLDPSDIEMVKLVHHTPHWKNPVITRIAPDRESAIAEEDQD
jgi:hypothetical protein